MANLVRVGVKKSFSSCAAVAGFESVQSVLAGITLAQFLQQMSCYNSSDKSSCRFNSKKDFQNRINLLRPDV